MLYAALEAAIASGNPACVLVPSTTELRRTRREIARRFPVGVVVETVDDWVGRLWRETGSDRSLVSSLVREALISQAVRATKLELLARSAETLGFARTIGLVAARLCNPSITDVPRPNVAEEREVLAILSAYEAILDHARLVEPSRAVALMERDGLPPQGFIAVNRVYDLSEAQERLLVAASLTTDVWVGLTWDSETVATEAMGDLVERLVDAGARIEAQQLPDRADELTALGARLYDPPVTEQLQPLGHLRMCTAAGPEAEIELIAEESEALLRSGIEPSHVAIVFRDPIPRLAGLRTALAERDIPVDVDVIVPFAGTPLGQALLGLLTVTAGDGGREEILTYLSSAYSGMEPDTVSALDARWRRRRTADPRRLLSDIANEGGAPANAVRLAQRLVTSPVDEDTTAIWKELADLLFETAALRRDPTRADTTAAVQADAASHRTIVRTVAEVGRLDALVSGVELVRVMGDVSVSSASGQGERGVQLLDATKARGRRFDAVIVGGMTAAEFSAEKPEPLQARLERGLGGRGGIEPRLAERLLFYTLVTRARERLVLVRQSTDAQGESVRPSVFWEDVIDLYCPADAERDAGEVPTQLLGRTLRLTDLSEAVPAFTPSRRRLRRDAESNERALRRPLSTSLGLGTEGAVGSVAMTELEVYATCPYRWFATRGVAARELDAMLDAREMGTRAHQMLADFYRLLPQRLGVERVTPGCLDEALALFDEVAEGVEERRRGGGAMNLAEELDMATARTRARGLVERDSAFLSGYVPVQLEWAFEHELVVGGSTINLRGTVDRVDRGPEGIVVTDYKLGAVDGRMSWEKDRRLQVPLYAAIASELLGAPVAGGVYRSLASGTARGFWLQGVPIECGPRITDVTDEEGLAEAIERAWAVAREAAGGIRAGIIAPQPASKQSCRNCPASAYCPKAVR